MGSGKIAVVLFQHRRPIWMFFPEPTGLVRRRRLLLLLRSRIVAIACPTLSLSNRTSGSLTTITFKEIGVTTRCQAGKRFVNPGSGWGPIGRGQEW